MAPSAESTKATETTKQRRRPGRVPVSCAECRRLKLRCDRKVPCETCTKRGCAAICPNGSLATGKSNNKYVLANTEELHARIDRMTRRIRELEYGLGTLQATVSDAVHPLLGEESLTSDGPSATLYDAPSPEAPSVGDDEVIDSLGTLSIGSRGDSRFYGASARGEYLLHATKPNETAQFFECSRLNERILAVPFPEAAPNQIDPETRQMVICHLPSYEEAKRLCDVFIVNSVYIPTSISRAELENTIEIVYHHRATPDGAPSSHYLGLLFIILGISHLFEPGPNTVVDAHEYFVLSRVALTFDSPITTTTVTSVQTMTFMAEYLEMSDVNLIPTGCAKAWMYLGLAMKMAHSVHLKSARFRLDEETGERRSRVFWHLFGVDAWSSFTFGRPPSTSLVFIDTDLPKSLDCKYKEGDEKGGMGFHWWNLLFVRLLHTVMSTAFSAKLPAYSAILELDRKLRDFHVPEYLRPTCNEVDPPGSFLTLQRWIVLSNKEWALLNIHRAYFAQAMREKPHDPLKHRYGLSVMALYRSAYRLVEGCRTAVSNAPPIFFRSNIACSKVLSAAIVMCLVVCTAPTSNLANPALDVLDKAHAIFQRGMEGGNLLASENADAVKNLHKQAHDVMNRDHDARASPLSADELDRLCGMTRVVTSDPSVPSVAPPARSDLLPAEDQIMSDYTALSGVSLPAPVAPFAFSDVSASPPQHAQLLSSLPTSFVRQDTAPQPSAAPPSLMQDIASSGAGYARSPMAFGIGQQMQTPYILDASWQDFVRQLGF
ncbi:hypothetical protein FA95DRAFT_1481722 [Auriscalpium vulgare]|uniref:Uncharacterized protein n=1 Tax=Auriscalpium vulgare TaxID=40419 RepID=A0ACB8SBA3_9AGAM|nr:hypothetical protein FA95DRAFT_1481722 [Auriscalpium vulgare]